MNYTKLVCAALLSITCGAAIAADEWASADMAKVTAYKNDPAARKAKLDECRKLPAEELGANADCVNAIEAKRLVNPEGNAVALADDEY